MGNAADIVTYVSATGLLSLISSCKSLYEFTTTAYHTNRDIKDIIGQAETERYFFAQWLKRVGLDNRSIDNLAPDDLLLGIQSSAQVATICRQISRALCALIEIDQLLKEESHGTGERHDTSLVLAELERALSMLSIDMDGNFLQGAQTVSARAKAYISNETANPRSNRAPNPFAWAFENKQRLQELVKTLKGANRALSFLISEADRDQIYRDVLPLVLERLGDLKSSLTMISKSQQEDTAAVLESLDIAMLAATHFQSHTRVKTVQQSLSTYSHFSVPKSTSAIPQKTFIPRIPLSSAGSIVTEEGKLRSDKRHWCTTMTIEGQICPVLVEVRRQLKHSNEEFEQNNVGLARLLKAASSDETSESHLSFNLLHFQGFLECQIAGTDGGGLAAAFVFQLEPDSQSTMTLGECLASEAPRPSLGVRFQIAQSLVRSFYSFLALEWYHKGLRNTNVIFPTRKVREQNGPNFQAAHIIGFDYSRPSDPKNQHSHKEELQKGMEIYRHPTYRKDPEGTDFSIEFDMYSLGVLLTEIAFWTPVSSETYSKLSLMVDDKLKASRYRALTFQVGEQYANAVKVLLTAELGPGLTVGSIAWTQAFSNKVVRCLDMCAA